MMRLLKLFGRLRKRRNPPPVRQPVETALSDVLKAEVAAITRELKAKQVSVRDLYEGEIASDTPEIGDQPLK